MKDKKDKEHRTKYLSDNSDLDQTAEIELDLEDIHLD